MAVYKDNWNGYKGGTWRVTCRFKNWKGETERIDKRGFATKKEAQEFEREFMARKRMDVNMSFESYMQLCETLKWKQKAFELTSEIMWIKKDAKAKLERERSENKNLEKSIKTLRRMLDEREEKIRALTEEIRNTEDRVSA